MTITRSYYPPLWFTHFAGGRYMALHGGVWDLYPGEWASYVAFPASATREPIDTGEGR